MIYSKKASFPYPVLSEFNNSYDDRYLNLEIINIQHKNRCYEFEIKYETNSSFIKNLIKEGKARYILVINANDNSFFILNNGQNIIKIPENRISLGDKTKMQLQVQSTDIINMGDCKELHEFYAEFKKDINIKKYSLLACSNIEEFRNPDKYPLDLFSYVINKDQEEDFKVELDTNLSTILLSFKKEEYLFNNFSEKRGLLNMYFFIGLQKALTSFVNNNIGFTEGLSEEGIDLNSMEYPDVHIDEKLYILMKDKNIEFIEYNNIDSIIYKISDDLIVKFVDTIERNLYYDN